MIYLDYAATTPVDPRVKKAMDSVGFANTMSLHSLGQEAKTTLEKSRSIVADAIGAKPSEIIFTSSATESNNFALKGIAFANKGNHIIISSIEHPCILESSKWLESQGFKVTKVSVDKYGMVDPKDIEKAINKDTVLVSIIHASNEIGTIQPINEIGKICKSKNVYFHTDAVQSFGKVDIDIENIDLLTASSHKIYGPKGAAILYVKQGTRIDPLLHGGGQEGNLRGSTVNLPAIVGFAKAIEICDKEEGERIIKLRDYIIKEVSKIENSHLNGHPLKRLYNNVNFWFDFIEGESLMLMLDSMGIAVSTGSACSSIKLEPSHVLLATGLRPEQSHGSIRVSLGRQTTKEDIDYFLKVLPKAINKLRDISPYKK